MKNTLVSILMLAGLLAGVGFGQSNSVYNSSTYSYTTQVTQGNSSTGASSVVAQSTGFAQGIPFLPYNLNAPITINRNAANAETVTPTSVTSCYPNSLTCTLSATFGFKHVAGESIQSGTFGLQEAVNIAVAAGSGTVVIDASWQGPSGNALILAAKGNANVMIQDNRNPTGAVFYQWNGSAYVQSGGGTQTYVLDTYLSPADGHGGTDFGFAMTNLCSTLGCSTLTAPINVKTVQTGICKVYTSLTIPAPIHFESSSCAFVPQSSMASAPVSLTSCSTTIGSTAVTCASTAGLSVGMAVGGDPTLGPEQYISSVTNGTTFQLILPASRNFLGILTNASATVKGVDSLIDAVTGQSVTGTGIPSSTTITVNPATQTFTLSNVATIGTLSPTDIVLAPGTVVSGLSLTAVAQVPVILVPPSNTSTSQSKPFGPNYGVTISNVSIRDPLYSHTSFGRSLTGLVGIQAYGQDNLLFSNVMVAGIRGSALIYGGYVPASTPGGSNVVRESDVNGFYAYSDGDILTGQASLALMTGLGNGDTTQDENNQNGFHDFHVVYPDSEGMVIGSYLHPGTTNGPRLLTFTGDNQFEAGSDSNFSFGASDMVRVLTGGGYNKILGGRWDTPGFGHSTFRISSAIDWTVTGAQLGASGGSSEIYNVGLTSSSPTVTYTSAGTGGGSSFVVGPYWLGVGAQLNDGVTCTPCNVWLATTAAVNGTGTQLTLASPYTGSQTSGTLTIQGGGYYFHLDQALSGPLNTIGGSYIDQASPVISLLSLGSATNGFLVGTGALTGRSGLTDHLESWTLNNLILPPVNYAANSSSSNINYNPSYLNSSGIIQTGSIATFASVGTGANPRVNFNAVCSTCNGDFHITFQQNVAADGVFNDLVAGTSSQKAVFSVTADNSTESWQFGLNGNALWTLFDNTNSKNALTVAPGTEAITSTGTITAPAFFPQSIAAGPYSLYFNDWYTSAEANPGSIGSPTGQSCQTNTANGDANHPGNILLTSGTAGTGTGEACNVTTVSGFNIVGLNTVPAWTWESEVFVPVLPGTTVGSYQAGIQHTAANPWTTGLGFYLSSANGVVNDWYCSNGTTYTDTTVAATVAWTRLSMVNDGSLVHWYIGGTQVCGTGTALVSITATSGQFAWTAVALSATSITMSVDYVDWQRQVVR
jgi:hypothetical protein